MRFFNENTKMAAESDTIKYQGVLYKRGFTDQPAWIPVNPPRGFVAVIPAEDEENYNAIEAKFKAQKKSLSLKTSALSEKAQKQIQKLELLILKAPLSQKQKFLDKIDAIKSQYVNK